MIDMFVDAALLMALTSAQSTISERACHRYERAVFDGRIRQLRLRHSTATEWSAEDVDCNGALFFPARLSPKLDPRLAKRITAAVNSRRGDAYIQIDATVHIKMYADGSGGVLTVTAVR